jgi:hypothetical protein
MRFELAMERGWEWNCDALDSRIGTLDFKDGAPSKATLDKVYRGIGAAFLLSSRSRPHFVVPLRVTWAAWWCAWRGAGSPRSGCSRWLRGCAPGV